VRSIKATNSGKYFSTSSGVFSHFIKPYVF
jgi:hypothetical protein